MAADDPHPVDLVWSVRPETPTRSDIAQAARRGVAGPKRQRANSPVGARRGVDARCDGGDVRGGRGPRARRRVRSRGRARARPAANCLEHQGSNAASRQFGKQQSAAVEQAGALLRELGHDVIIRDPEYPPLAYTNYLPRFLRGISDDADAQAHPERLERRTRVLARLGSYFSDRRMDALRVAEPGLAKRIQSIFDDVDVVVTPGNARARPASAPTSAGVGCRRCWRWRSGFPTNRSGT